MKKNKVEDFEVTVIGSKSKRSKASIVNPDGDDYFHLSLQRDNRITSTGKIRLNSVAKMFAFVYKSSTPQLFAQIQQIIEDGNFEPIGEDAKLQVVIDGSWQIEECNSYFVTDDKGNQRKDSEGNPVVKSSVAFFCFADEAVEAAFRRATRNLRWASVEQDDDATSAEAAE